jgi:DNA-binding CsgD family transcriptional regulator
VLLGREEERLALDRLLAEAREGRSGVLALVGEPGIGKTVLLDYAAGQAGGMRVLRARGIESEAEIPFAGLAELLRPALPALGEIPPPQADALAGALALAPPSAQDRFAVGAATLSLLSSCADEQPLLLLVDDAHRLDGSSAEALLFAARRLLADPIALVLTVREGESSLVDGSDLRVLRVAGLGRQEAQELLADHDVTGAIVERLYETTAGNPLALIELAAEADRVAVLPGEAPIPIATSISAAFLRRFEELPEETRRLLLLIAADPSGDLAVHARAAASLGVELTALDAAVERELVSVAGGAVEFSHPLARSAVYARASPAERREVHGAFAAVLPDRDVDRRAWHLAAASVGPDSEAADALAQAGARASARSAYAAAAAAYEHAARLSPGADARSSLLVAAAEAASLAGDSERMLRLLDEVDANAPGVTYLRGELAMRRGPVSDGYRLMVEAAEQVVESDREKAVEMFAHAARACFYSGDSAAMLSAAERAVELAGDDASERTAFLAQMAYAIASVPAGLGQEGMAATRRAIEILEGSPELRDDPSLLGWAAIGPLWLREADTGRDLLDRAFEEARTQVALGVLPALLLVLARDQATTDAWLAAQASYEEAIRLTHETGHLVDLAALVAGFAWLAARQGREEACRALAAEAQQRCEDVGVGFYGIWPQQALGDLELALGRPEEAIEHYREQCAQMEALGIADVDLSPGPELVEAYLRLGRRDEALAEADAFEQAAEAKGQAWALARAARCRGLLAEDDELDASFGEALAQHARTPDVFETARTRLAYGARLRRARRRVDAREHLRAAYEAFDRLGAANWAETAAAELAATGETARRRDVTTLDELTPQELQIALLLAQGKTTREAAAAVFLSPKTVEYHLRHVYRKLGIRSREELAAAFSS